MKNINTIFIKYITMLILVTTSSCGQNTIKSTNIKPEDLPKGIDYRGKIIEAINWKDNNGDNLVLITETGEYPSLEENFENYRDAELYAYHFLINVNSNKLSWRIYDFVKNCPVDIKANFIKKTLQLTDLNQNGIAEIWVMYKVACYGDVSPSEMKIIMYENQKKHAMRGYDKVKVSKTEVDGGNYKFDSEFLKGSQEFRDFAIKLWNKNIW